MKVGFVMERTSLWMNRAGEFTSTVPIDVSGREGYDYEALTRVFSVERVYYVSWTGDSKTAIADYESMRERDRQMAGQTVVITGSEYISA